MGEDEHDQLLAIAEVRGIPPRSLLAGASRRKLFFDDEYNPIIKETPVPRKPGSKTLRELLEGAKSRS